MNSPSTTPTIRRLAVLSVCVFAITPTFVQLSALNSVWDKTAPFTP